MVLGVLAPSAALAGTIDQQTTVDEPSFSAAVYDNQSGSQTFRAGRSGALDRVDLYSIGTLNPPSAPLRVEIYQAAPGGCPSGAPIASTELAIADVPTGADTGYFPVNFATPATVVAANRYAIVARSATVVAASFALGTADGNPYVEGVTCYAFTTSPDDWLLDSLDIDLLFKTYVADPPATPAPIPAAPQQQKRKQKCKKGKKGKKRSATAAKKKQKKKCKKSRKK
jgi:hypothetical protein